MFTALLPAAGNQDQTGTLGATLVAESTPRSVWSWRSSRLAEPAASDLGVSLPHAGLQATKTALRTGPVDKTGDELRHEGQNIMSFKIERRAYVDMFGPTTGDRVRLADTDLIIEVEKDFTTYGEEVKFGGGKVIRDGMGQSQVTSKQGAVDTVITNAIVLDHWGIVKGDVAIKDGKIHSIGKAGNPDIQPNVTIVIGPGTDVIAGEGRILTAGGFGRPDRRR